MESVRREPRKYPKRVIVHLGNIDDLAIIRGVHVDAAKTRIAHQLVDAGFKYKDVEYTPIEEGFTLSTDKDKEKHYIFRERD